MHQKKKKLRTGKFCQIALQSQKNATANPTEATEEDIYVMLPGPQTDISTTTQLLSSKS